MKFELISAILNVLIVSTPGECANWMVDYLPFEPEGKITMLRQKGDDCWIYYRVKNLPSDYKDYFD